MYRILLSCFLLLLLSVTVSASGVGVLPDTVHPGDIFVLTLDSGERATAEAEFLHKPVPFHTAENGTLIAFVPVDVSTAPERYEIRVSKGTERLTTEIRVIPRAFRTIHLTVSEEKVTLSPENQKRVEREYLLQQKYGRGSHRPHGAAGS